jgi:hypothetical protein
MIWQRGASALKAMLRDPELRSRAGRERRALVAARYTVAQTHGRADA